VGGSVVLVRDPRPHPARVALFASGHTVSDFARFYGCTLDWASRVLSGAAPASARFRADLSRFLDVPEADLFPDRGVV
jgi:hypothetical protein